MPLVFVTACKNTASVFMIEDIKPGSSFNILTVWIQSEPAARRTRSELKHNKTLAHLNLGLSPYMYK